MPYSDQLSYPGMKSSVKNGIGRNIGRISPPSGRGVSENASGKISLENIIPGFLIAKARV